MTCFRHALVRMAGGSRRREEQGEVEVVEVGEEEEEEDSTTVMVKGLKESTMEAEVSWVQTDERFGETSFCDFEIL